MLHRPMSRAWVAGPALCALLLGPAPAGADIYYETAYVPTSSVVALPTSSLLSTSYVVPTAYSTTYLPTSAIYPTSEVYTTSATYVPTYRTFRYRPRRYVERSYLAAPSLTLSPTAYVAPSSYLLPTSYVVPTSYYSSTLTPTSYVVPTAYYSSTLTPTSYVVDNGVVATSATVCDDVTAPAPARPATPRAGASSGNSNSNASGEPTITSVPSSGAISERQPQGSVDDGTPSSNVTPPLPAPAPAAPRTPAAPQSGAAQEPPALNSGGSAPSTPPPADGANDLPIPKPGAIGGKPGADGTSTRSSLRPTFDLRNVLRGKVVSYELGRPEEGVTVVVTNLTKKYADRQAMSDAYGEFNISLPEGDWAVKVRMPSGNFVQVASDYLTASNGRVVDGAGRNVKEFLITR